MVDTQDLKSCAEWRPGSSPGGSTIKISELVGSPDGKGLDCKSIARK